MTLHPIDYKTFVVYNGHWDYYKKALNKYDVNVILSSNKLERLYPKDIALNVSRTKNCYFHKSGYTDSKIVSKLDDKVKFVGVRQGYSKCSTLILKENTVITSDHGLVNKYRENGIKTYYLPSGSILLPGYDTGFIGGCGGMISRDEIILYGNLEEYKYKIELKEIFNREKIKYYYPRDVGFIDRGSIIGVIGGIYD